MIPYAVLTVSDRAAAGHREDASGPLAHAMLDAALGGNCVELCIVPDDREAIGQALVRLADTAGARLIVTTGGTGLAPRDVTPEATRDVVDREVPGMAEAIRAAGLAHTPRAMLSRGVCGVRGRTLIINCSGSPKAVREQLETVLPVIAHAVELLGGDVTDCAR